MFQKQGHLKYIFALLIGLYPALAGPAKAEYLLAPGDVIEFSAVGLPELRQRSRVDPNGEVSLPLIGQMKASGLSLTELRAEVKSLIPTKSLRRKTPQGLDILVIDPNEVNLEIADYRPIYVSGDVERPGEQSYRIGLTVRQAVAVCGGFSQRRLLADQLSTPQTADLKAEYRNLWTEYTQAQVQAWRVETEMREAPEFAVDRDELKKLPIETDVRDQILRFEEQKFGTNQTTFAREKNSLAAQVQQSDEQIKLVQEQLGKTQEGAQLALAELQRVQGSYEKGVIPITRVAEERRYTLMAQTQNLQTTERLGQLQKEREELVRKLSELEVGRSVTLSRELQEAIIRLTSIKTRLGSVDAKLLYASSGSQQLQNTMNIAVQPHITVVRKVTTGFERIDANEETEIFPGDTVVVTMPSRFGSPLSK
ncbi:polysaccharide biosynthesis/export family protein [Microvirga pudoricolor]|uniref:polysaccharide biosynthesis/export family protein n=1 Tax=Microvirga pudoricolor TaxID=2778729 RepID=UPI00194FA8B2|nr:polysaccharide biosynthesis/export family protein [Microvirga pudoricolor]MBM6593010.1 polysaccharide biosynthesis/export family protein [Microvirga pudoricolor]